MKIRRHQNQDSSKSVQTDSKKLSEILPNVEPGSTDYLDITIERWPERKSLVTIEFEKEDIDHIGKNIFSYCSKLISEYESIISKLYSTVQLTKRSSNSFELNNFVNTFIRKDLNRIKELGLNSFDEFKILHDIINEEIPLPLSVATQTLNWIANYCSTYSNYDEWMDKRTELSKILIDLPTLKGIAQIHNEGESMLINGVEHTKIQDLVVEIAQDELLFKRPFIGNMMKSNIRIIELFNEIVIFILSELKENDYDQYVESADNT